MSGVEKFTFLNATMVYLDSPAVGAKLITFKDLRTEGLFVYLILSKGHVVPLKKVLCNIKGIITKWLNNLLKSTQSSNSLKI